MPGSDPTEWQERRVLRIGERVKMWVQCLEYLSLSSLLLEKAGHNV